MNDVVNRTRSQMRMDVSLTKAKLVGRERPVPDRGSAIYAMSFR